MQRIASQDTSAPKLGSSKKVTSPNDLNYVSILKRKEIEQSLMRGDGLSFEPKMISGKIGALLDLQQQESAQASRQRHKTMVSKNPKLVK